MFKKKKDNCEFLSDCGGIEGCKENKIDSCECCSFYYMIDSGYGNCRIFPETKVVAWCRSTCGQYKKR